MDTQQTSTARRVAEALDYGSSLVGCPGGRWQVVGATGMPLKDERGKTLTVSSQRLKSWGLWPWGTPATAESPLATGLLDARQLLD